MSVDIKRLSCELIQDYFDFFEQRAFTDNSPYRCYCQVYQMSDEENRKIFNGVKESEVGRVAKAVAQRQIESGILQGYLAFDYNTAVGWCVLKSLRNGGGAVSLPLYCSRRSMMRKMTDMKLLMDSRKSGKNDMSGIPAVR